MKNSLRYTVLIVMLCVLSFLHSASAQSADNQQKVADKDAARLSWYSLKRFSFKTNAVDWFAVIPNFGVEYQLTDNPYKLMTVGLTAKCNWNTFHGTGAGSYSPATVYDLFDVRSEFRYYYRTTEKPKTKIQKEIDILQVELDTLCAKRDRVESKNVEQKNFYNTLIANQKAKIVLKKNELKEYKKNNKLKFGEWFKENIWTTDRQNPHKWRAQYIGPYINYSKYAFKFGESGISAQNAFGLGATAGFMVPLYQYKRGAIDVDFGFSLGLLLARHDAFKYNIDGNNYTKLHNGNAYFSLNESSSSYRVYPVVSELKVAFVWRRTSIKHEVQIDEETRRLLREEQRQFRIYDKDIDVAFEGTYKHVFDTLDRKSVKEWKLEEASDTTDHVKTYSEKFMDALIYTKEAQLNIVENCPVNDANKQILRGKVEKLYNQIEESFEREWTKEKKQIRNGKIDDTSTSQAISQQKAAKDKPEKEKTPKDKVPKDKTPKEKTPKEKPEKK